MQHEESLKHLGFEVMSSEEGAKETIALGANFIAVSVDIKMPKEFLEAVKQMENIVLKRLTSRKTPIYTRDFRGGEGVLTFITEAPLPKTYHDAYRLTRMLEDYSVQIGSNIHVINKPVATTFPDFCWTLSEGTSPHTVIEVQTPVAKGAVLGDLTWVLPSKFCDDLIENMHALNQNILEGTMQDAILYGPFFR